MFVSNTPLIALVLSVMGCTSIQVRPLERSANVSQVCIQENPKVIVADFLTTLRDGFDRHGIASVVYSGAIPEKCEYVCTYTALQSWDFATYLSHAEIRMESKGRKIAYAEYHLDGKGGLSLMKWQDTKTKIDPVIDGFLKNY